VTFFFFSALVLSPSALRLRLRAVVAMVGAGAVVEVGLVGLVDLEVCLVVSDLPLPEGTGAGCFDCCPSF
jgi:hypothetical protein